MLLKTKQLSQFFRLLTCSVDGNDVTCKSYFLFLFLFFVKVLDYEIIKRDSTAMTHLWSVYKDDGEGSCDTYSSTKEKNCCDTW